MGRLVKFFSALLWILASEEALAQLTFAAPDSSLQILDVSEINNQIFLRTEEDIFSGALQFVADDIERVASHPVLLAQASWTDVQKIPSLTGLEMFRIMQHRKENDLLEIGLVSRIHSFMRTSSAPEPLLSFRTRAALDPNAENSPNYTNGYYHGSPVKSSSRLIAKNDGILLAITQTKNAGEPIFFDHVTGCAAIDNPLHITDDITLPECVLGDYSLSFGQGLLFSNGYSQVPFRDVNASVEPRTIGIQPYISSSSFRFFRGAASEISSGMISVSGFFSDRKIDAAVDSEKITSLYTNGYHRTTSELTRKNQAEAKTAGGHLSFTALSDDSYLQFGTTGYALQYDKPVDSSSSGFHGQHHSMFSLDMRGIFSQISWNGEYARMISDAGSANALAISVIEAPTKFLEISLNYRNLPANFISPFGSTFAAVSSNAQNETGWYLGSKLFMIPNRLMFFGSMNLAHSENSGNAMQYSDIRFGSKYSFLSLPLKLSAELRSYGKGPVFSVSGDSLSKNILRFDANAALSHEMSIAFIGELERYISQTDSIAKKGYLLGIKWNYLPMKDLSVFSGIYFFNTDSYSSRFYSNEADLAGTASFVALYGSGYRYYLQCTYAPAKQFVLSARISQTHYAPLSQSPVVTKTIFGAQCDVNIY